MTADTALVALKGVYNTNENPLRCSICSVVLGQQTINVCCGKSACDECSEAGKIFDQDAGRCLLCDSTTSAPSACSRSRPRGATLGLRLPWEFSTTKEMH